MFTIHISILTRRSPFPLIYFIQLFPICSSRNIIGGDYPPTATASSSSTSHSSHYQSRQQQLHESEFLTSAKVRGQHAAVELFQQQHGGPLLSSSAAADIRHQHHHQSDFGSIVGGNAVDAGTIILGPFLGAFPV